MLGLVTQYKEFWLGVILLALALFCGYLLKVADTVGNNMVGFLHDYAQARGISDQTVYTSQTHGAFVQTGQFIVFFSVGACVEFYLLRHRNQIKNSIPFAWIVFSLSVFPLLLSLTRTLWQLYFS